MHESGGCGPILVSPVDIDTQTNCDRNYVLGSGFNDFFEAHPDVNYLFQDAHDPNDHGWSEND